MENKKFNWSKFWWIILIIIIYIIINSGTWFFLIANNIPAMGGGDSDVSYYELITVKYVAKELYGARYLEFYKFWHKPVIYLSMIIGYGLSITLTMGCIKNFKHKKEFNQQMAFKKMELEYKREELDFKKNESQKMKEMREKQKYIKGY